MDKLDHIISLLTEIRDRLPVKSVRAQKKTAVATEADPVVGKLIATYIEAWQKRYQTKARPGIPSAIGVLTKLSRDYKPENLRDLLRLYCQMEDSWFTRKNHDIATFKENITKVALALEKGLTYKEEKKKEADSHFSKVSRANPSCPLCEGNGLVYNETAKGRFPSYCSCISGAPTQEEVKEKWWEK